ncbi:MAG: DNA mismatch repair protein MutL, partial [Bacillota bacterium]|nr:DNA mismatch repair protein MutL [Bacillota bacterium]
KGPVAPAFPHITVLGSAFGTYIIGVEEDQLYLIDQHAAHERVFYEKLMAQYRNREKDAQLLLTPMVRQVSPAVKAMEEEWLPALTELGYAVEEFGPNLYVTKEVPAFLTLEEAMDFLEAVFDELGEAKRGEVLSPKIRDKIIMKACKSAVKGNQHLERAEMERLLEDLAAAENPFSCPHGRPTLLRLSRKEIEHLFKRA